jgi:hypothetical protein
MILLLCSFNLIYLDYLEKIQKKLREIYLKKCLIK